MTAHLQREAPALRCMKCGFADAVCAYCSMPLSSRHEHDHVPVPAFLEIAKNEEREKVA